MRADRWVWPLVLGACGAPGSRAPERAALAPVAASGQPVSCEGLTRLAPAHVEITEARLVPAGAVSTRTHSASLPAYCRVLGASHPTADSDIRFEVAVPAGDSWNGRYLQVGNGAFAGRIPEGDMVDGLATGYAVAGTDDGHEDGPGDVRWALGHPEKVIDFGYRAVNETHDAALAIVRAYTGRAARFSYFVGCSDGGREGLMEAQRYPADFDGIVAGAPPIETTRVLFDFAWNVRAVTQAPGSAIPRSKLAAIEAAAVKACGDPDGVIEDPPGCRFDPGVLLCRGAEDDACLTSAQVEALRRIYAGPRNPRTGEPVAPGLEPGGEAEEQPDGFALWISGPAPNGAPSGDFLLSSNFFRYMVFDDPAYDIAQLNFDGDVAMTDAKVGAILDPDSPDLRAFARRGGKLIHHHGWSDDVVPPRMSIDYFERVHARMGDTSAFYRLFMAPGMAHCQEGRGPNVLPALEAVRAWVERGTPPERLVATKTVDNSPSKPIERTRPLCPYPERAEWDGRGDRTRAESYRCTPPGTSR